MRSFITLVPFLFTACQAIDDLNQAELDRGNQENQNPSPELVNPDPVVWVNPELDPNEPQFDYSPEDLRSIFGNPTCSSFLDPELDQEIMPDCGLFAQVRTPPAGFNSAEWSSLQKYVTQGLGAGTLFVNNINIPTRRFDTGFLTLAGRLSEISVEFVKGCMLVMRPRGLFARGNFSYWS